MNLEDFVNKRQANYDGFRRWMAQRIGPSVVMAEEGWEKTFLVWETMIDNGVPDPVMDRVLHAVGGGWYTPKAF